MAKGPNAPELQRMAEHRGLKLVKSRRRKPGTGDYGKFGLTDAAGKPLLGIGKAGLTASAQDIEAYLRAGTLTTWQKSAGTTPDRSPPKPKTPPQPADTAPIKPKSRAKPIPPPKPPPVAKPAPPPEPQLAIRPAKSGDAEAIASLLNQSGNITVNGKTVQQNLAATRRAGGGLLLAELGKPIGCCGWAVVQTVDRGPIGRITMLVVAADHRRRGIARTLLAAAERALADAGCAVVEAMSDIQINNAHNFFRTLEFKQSSYRFTRKLTD